MRQTYDKSFVKNIENIPENILKPSNRQQLHVSGSDLFDNLTFTPLKNQTVKSDKLEKGPKIIISMNSESDYDDSLNMQECNKENETHSIVTITSMQKEDKWVSVNNHGERYYTETPMLLTRKHPETSSPKEVNSPNFSINTDFSRISELSFCPNRFSTEKKLISRVNNDTHDIINDININRPNSDTYTKESPNTPCERNSNQAYVDMKPPHFFQRDQHPRFCRQALFREYQLHKEPDDKKYPGVYDHYIGHNGPKVDLRSPPRSITPPLQSIPEESVQFSDSNIFLKNNQQTATFTIDRTFDHADRKSLSNIAMQTWSKKTVTTDNDVWKIPVPLPKKSLKSRPVCNRKDTSGSEKVCNTTFEKNKSVNQNLSINLVGNVYSQSFTVDPFMSANYFYDEEAVEKIEIEFKRWLNCILTPHADLDSNTEQKIDVGKAWLENRNREVPIAPTKEQVSNAYHTSRRLESVRRAARNLLLNPEIAQVKQKLYLQIDKKLIAIRTDRNLHLDVGLQKIIMEILFCYNPLWLRIGLETVYGVVLPLRSNSDIEGLTTFIIQRMFKNPHLKNKHSKSTAPNMLLPAYMEAIKKFTLKKFFTLVFFLDQAKQRKLISHDPCLFCRNAICKESREIIIRFTRELIAGIGDITKHLRPLGYVVGHKQSYLDEYKYAVHNIAIDIRDGVRLTKVMEIILIKDGLLKQLRTPPISRLQKVHNVQVALNALKEAHFNIVGDITAHDIADGHREKTLSLLWQIIHEFRAPLFENAANVIQTWWRKKFEIIMEKKKVEERLREKLNNAARTIQHFWRTIIHRRYEVYKMQQATSATITIQKYFRMWLCRSRLQSMKRNVLLIENWYLRLKLAREAKITMQRLKLERELLKNKSATVLQSYVKRWLCAKHYRMKVKNIILIQSMVRVYLMRKRYLLLRKSAIYIQQKYRGRLLMKQDMQNLSNFKKSAIVIQSYYRMYKARQSYRQLKKYVHVIEERYLALCKMRSQRDEYTCRKKSVVIIQALVRKRLSLLEYTRKRNSIILLQRHIRSYLEMRKQRSRYITLKNASIVLQKHIRSYLTMKKERQSFINKQTAAILIQTRYRSYLMAKELRMSFIHLRYAVLVIQKRYRALLIMRQQRYSYLKLKNAVSIIQEKYRAWSLMKNCKRDYNKMRLSTIALQQKYRALLKMREVRFNFLELKSSCIIIQNAYRNYIFGKKQRQQYLKIKEAIITIQKWFRSTKKSKEVKQNYQQCKQACVTIQRIYRAYIIGRKHKQEYLQIKTATIRIQQYYRSYIEMRTLRNEFIKLKAATVTIQRFYKSHIITKQQRASYLEARNAASLIQDYYRCYKQTKIVRLKFIALRAAVITVQRRYQSLCLMRQKRFEYLKITQAALTIQMRWRALIATQTQRRAYLDLKEAVLTIQTRYRAYILMKKDRMSYTRAVRACITIQSFYRAYILTQYQRAQYLALKQASITLQRRYKSLIAMRNDRNYYLTLRSATIILQRRYRANCKMVIDRSKYLRINKACVTIQKAYKAYIAGKRQRMEYATMKSAVILIQKRFRLIRETREIRRQYLVLKHNTRLLQRRFRALKAARNYKRNKAATTIQNWYISLKKRNECRSKFLIFKKSVIAIQSIYRMYVLRKNFLELKKHAVTIQNYYRSYKLRKTQRNEYIQTRNSVIKIQAYVRRFIEMRRYKIIRTAVITIQAWYRLKQYRSQLKSRRENSAICLQKHIRRYLAQSRYQLYRKKIIFIQKMWRGILFTRLLRCEFLQKKKLIIQLQSMIRGYLVRKHVQILRGNLLRQKEEMRRHWAASKIQALFRGHSVRVCVRDKRISDLRQRWREGGLKSTEQTLRERHDEAMDVLKHMYGIEALIRAFRSLELLTEVYPMLYHDNAASIVKKIYGYMDLMNRSISSMEVLISAASIFVNLTKYNVTGPKIYQRDHVVNMLKFMLRFSNNQLQLFCILATHLWLFSKYDAVKKDLTEFLHTPEIHKKVLTIKSNIDRMKRLVSNSTRHKFNTPQTSKCVSYTVNHSFNQSVCSNGKPNHVLPAIESDYGINRADKPRYFQDAQQAINCLFVTYKL